MRVRSLLVLSVVAVLFVASTAQAADIYQYVFSQSTYVVSPGGTVAVTVSLQESGGGTVLKDIGLVGIGVGVTWNQSAPANPAAVLSASDIAVASGFPQVWWTGIDVPVNWDPDLIHTSQSAGLSAAIAASATPALVKAAELGTGVYTIALGTFTFTAGATSGVTHIRATDVSSEDDNVVGLYPNSSVLDASILDGTATIMTPEPSTLVLSGIAALGFLGLRWRRKAARVAA